MAVESAPKQPLLCWTVCAYRKPDMSEEDYHRYLSENHGPLVRGYLAKHGIVSYSIRHNTRETRAKMGRIFGPQFANIADYDSVITATFPDVECFVRFKEDPDYKVKIMPDHENFADTKRSKMTIGWLEDQIWDGKVLADQPEETRKGAEKAKEQSGVSSWMQWWRKSIV